jgi:uncharacterized protein (DUF849 family)
MKNAHTPMLQAALNGARPLVEHPAIPRTPAELASDARASVREGAAVVHVHAFDDNGDETLAAQPNAAVLREIRATCPGIPISLTTRANLEPDPQRRLNLIMSWLELPELVTANQGEPGILEICRHLGERGVGIEAGLLQLSDAEAFRRSNFADYCTRVLLEPLDSDPDEAVAHARAMERVLELANIRLPRIYHGDGIASWAVSRYGLSQGHGIRTGLEDTTALADGRRPADNAELVRAAQSLISERKNMR